MFYKKLWPLQIFVADVFLLNFKIKLVSKMNEHFQEKSKIKFGPFLALLLAISISGCAVKPPKATISENAVIYTPGSFSYASKDLKNGGETPSKLISIKQTYEKKPIINFVAFFSEKTNGVYTATIPQEKIPGNQCFIISNAQGGYIDVRSNDFTDSKTFYSPINLTIEALEREKLNHQTQAETIRNNYSNAKKYLSLNKFYANDKCIPPPLRVAPTKPFNACNNVESSKYAAAACWGTLLATSSCEKIISSPQAASLFPPMIRSLGCSALIAAAQNEEVNLSDIVIDGMVTAALTTCLKGIADGENIAANSLCSLLSGGIFISRMNQCIESKAIQCRNKYMQWSEQVKKINEEQSNSMSYCLSQESIYKKGISDALEHDKKADDLSVKIDKLKKIGQSAVVITSNGFSCTGLTKEKIENDFVKVIYSRQ